MVCMWLEKCQKIGMGVHKGIVVSFIPTLFGCFWGIPSLYVSFCLMFFVTSGFSFFLVGGGGGDIELLIPDTHVWLLR